MRQLDERLVPQVLCVARAAEACVVSIFGRMQMQVSRKVDQSPVTEADIASHKCLVRGLEALGTGWLVVSEEDAASSPYRAVRGCYWLLDPLDGTKEFIGRNGEFTINIALIDCGQALNPSFVAASSVAHSP